MTNKYSFSLFGKQYILQRNTFFVFTLYSQQPSIRKRNFAKKKCDLDFGLTFLAQIFFVQIYLLFYNLLTRGLTLIVYPSFGENLLTNFEPILGMKCGTLVVPHFLT